MPDISCVLSGADIWIESKQPQEPKRRTTPLFGSNHKFTLEQRNWMLTHKRAGGRCFGFILTGKWRIMLDGSTVASAGINAMPLYQIIQESIWHSEAPVFKDEWDKLRAMMIA